MRRVASPEEFPQSARAMVERLIEARLLVVDRRSGTDVVEVAHESLLRQWPALTAWLQADADDLKIVDGIERAAGEWARNGKQDGWLDHRAERLAAAERFAARKDFWQRLGGEGIAYLDACRARVKRLQLISRGAVAAVGVMILLAIATIGYLQWDKAQQLAKYQLDLEHVDASLRGELSGVSLLRGGFDSALRLASSGTRIDIDLGSPTGTIKASPAAAALAAAVSEANWRFALRHEDAVKSAAFSAGSIEPMASCSMRPAEWWGQAKPAVLQRNCWRNEAPRSILQQLVLEGLRQELDAMVPLVKQVMKQTKARIFRGDTHAEGKLLSVFEPSTGGHSQGQGRQAERVRQDGVEAAGGPRIRS